MKYQGPAVERAFFDARDIVGHEVVAEPVALVGRAPGRPGAGLNCEPDAIADAGRENLLVLAVGIEGQHRGAIGLISPGCAERLLAGPGLEPARRLTHAVPDIARRADRYQHGRVVRADVDVSCR